MVGLGRYVESLTRPVIFEDSPMDAKSYIEEVLLIARKCSNNMLESHWTYEQNVR